MPRGSPRATSADRGGWLTERIDLTWSRFAQIVAELRRKSQRVPLLDALVAATALVEDIAVITQDRDYQAISALKVIRV